MGKIQNHIDECVKGDSVWVTDGVDAVQISDDKWYLCQISGQENATTVTVWKCVRHRFDVDWDFRETKTLEQACVELVEIIYDGTPLTRYDMIKQLPRTTWKHRRALDCIAVMPIEDIPPALGCPEQLIQQAALERLKKRDPDE